LALTAPDPALAKYPFRFEDASGAEVVVDGPINRIVSLNRQTSECIVALGAGDKIIATGDATVRNNPYLGLENLPQVPGTGLESAEGILALGPDAVFAYRDRSPYIDLQLGGSGVKVVRMDNNDPATEDEELLLLGRLLEREGEAEALISWRRGLRDLAASRVSRLSEGERLSVAAFLLSPLVGGGSLRLYPAYGKSGRPGPGEGYASVLAGGADAFSGIAEVTDLSGGTVQISDEYLLKVNPQAITFHGSIYGGYDGPGTDALRAIFEEVRNIPSISLTDANIDRRLYFFHTDMLGGNKKEIGTLQLIKYLYPYLMDDIEPSLYASFYFDNFIHRPFRGVWFYADDSK
jgi:iron complex transport system substrate-binding protein